MTQRAAQLKGLVFDLDDTLYCQADYKRSGFKAVAAWLAEHEGRDAAESYRALEQILETKGASYPTIFDDFVSQQHLDTGLAQTLTQIFIAHQPQLECYPGVDNLLEQLQGDYCLGILTDGRQRSQEKKITALNLQPKMDAILCSDSLGLSKPATELFQWFEDRFQLPGQQLAYIGDNPTKDFLGANQRNWLTIRVLTGEHRQRQVAGEQNAKLELPAVTDLIAWLKKLKP